MEIEKKNHTKRTNTTKPHELLQDQRQNPNTKNSTSKGEQARSQALK